MFEILALFFTAFAIRLFAIRGEVQQIDSHGHLYRAKELKAQRKGPFGSIKLKVVGSTYNSVPYLWHWIIGFFSITFINKHQKYWNPFLDSLFAILIYFISLNLGLSNNEAVLSYGLYLFTPMWFSRLAIGPRINSFTPRLSGEIAGNLFFIVTCLPIDAPYWVLLILGVLFASYVLASSKFGIQVLFFITPIVSVFLLSWFPIFTLAIAFVIILIASKGKFLKSLKQQINHLKNYFLINLSKEVYASTRNMFDEEYKLKTDEKLLNYFLRLLVLLTLRNSYTGVLIKLPLLWISFVFLLLAPDLNILDLYWEPVAAALVVYFLTNIPKLLFLGEAERYLNYVAFFIILSTVMIFGSINNLWLFLLLFYGINYLAVEGIVLPILNKKSSLMEIENKKIINYLATMEKSVVLCFPYSAGGGYSQIMANTPHYTLDHTKSSDEFSRKLKTKYGAKYPFIDLNKINNLRDEFGVKILIVDAKLLKLRLHPKWKPSVEWKEVDLDLNFQRLYICK